MILCGNKKTITVNSDNYSIVCVRNIAEMFGVAYGREGGVGHLPESIMFLPTSESTTVKQEFSLTLSFPVRYLLH